MSSNITQPLHINLGEGEQKQKFSLRELVIKYLSYFPLFVLSFVICFGSAIMYIRYKVPIYKASVQVLVNNGGSNSYSQQDIVTQAVSGVRPINLENEMQLIKSLKLLEKVVENGAFNVVYSKEGNIKTFDAYNTTPFKFIPLRIDDSTSSYTIKLKNISNSGGQIETKSGVINFKWNDSISMPPISFKLMKLKEEIPTIIDPYVIKWKPFLRAAAEMQGRITVGTLSSKTSIIVLSVIGENRKRGEDFLNLLVQEISKSDVELKKEASVNTIEFINNRLDLVAKDLGDVELISTNAKKGSRFFETNDEYQYYQGRLIESEKQQESLEIEIATIGLIEEYVKNNKSVNKSKVIPSTFEINDNAFSGLVSKYNELQSRKERNDLVIKEDNTIVIELDNEIKQVKISLLEAAANLRNAKNAKIKTFNSRFTTDMGLLSTVPDKERIRLDLNRQKQIKEKLYLYLLQKREETAIASISTMSNYQSMDGASSSSTPIEPKADQIRTFALAIGLLFPIAFIYLLDSLNDKITRREDIVNKTNIPIAGEISHVESNQTIVVENSRNMVAEQFRIFRSNLQFILPNHSNKDGATTFLITSSISGEGKSFISLNLAAVLALTGKKVALLAFDLRKLKGLKLPEHIDDYTIGITNFLIGQTNDLTSIYKVLSKHPSLHIYNTGPIPPNPSELIISPRMDVLFKELKENYDYLVIDSAPVGLVSDSFSLSKYADSVIYIVRQRFTFKKQINFINDLKSSEKLTNMSIVVNDVNLAGRYGYYGYGYGYGYGYSYRYGLGYGYNRYIYGGKKNDPYFEANKNGYFDDTIKLSWWQKIFGK